MQQDKADHLQIQLHHLESASQARRYYKECRKLAKTCAVVHLAFLLGFTQFTIQNKYYQLNALLKMKRCACSCHTYKGGVGTSQVRLCYLAAGRNAVVPPPPPPPPPPVPVPDPVSLPVADVSVPLAPKKTKGKDSKKRACE